MRTHTLRPQTVRAYLLVTVILLWGAPRAVGARRLPSTVPQHQALARILEEVVICKQPRRYIGWPSITRASNGDLLVAFSGDRDWHVCPWGKTFIVRSSDGGENWSEPQVAANTPLDDRDPGLATLPNGDIILSFFTSVAFDNPDVERYRPYRNHAAKLSAEVRERWLGGWLRKSQDHGRTWGPYTPAPVHTPHGPTVLDDGRLLLVRPSVYESRDQGSTWKEIARIDRDPQTWKSRYAFLSEQHAVQTADRRIVALSRYADGGDIELRQIESDDGGLTWSTPRKTGMSGYPAHLLRLENGWLVAVYGRRISLMGQRACLTTNHGKTWLVEHEILLSNAVPQDAGHLGYPCSAELPDGSIWTVYYQVEKEADGEYPCLMGTHWEIKKKAAMNRRTPEGRFFRCD